MPANEFTVQKPRCYFRPEHLEVKPGIDGAFVDGGVTPHNNPAFQMLMLATLKGYGLDWPLGPEELSLVSVGTGTHIETREPKNWENKLVMLNGLTSLQMMFEDAGYFNEPLLQWLSNSPTKREMDDAGNIELLATVGDKVGNAQVSNAHFPKCFDAQ